MTGVRHDLRGGMSRVRANPLEFGLLAFAVIAIAFAIYETGAVALTGDRSRDLTFSGATDELARMLATRGAARVGTLAQTRPTRANGSAIADTIAVAADSIVEPAFAAGGFVRDQISLYNDFAVRQAVQSALDGDSAAHPRTEAPGLLQTVYSENGTRALSDRPSPYGMVIRSPYAEGSWREVRTIDWRSSPGLLGYAGQVSLPADQPAGLFRAALNGRECTINRDAPEFYLYCRSALAADAKRFYDFGFQVGPGANGGRFVSAGPYRQHTIWRNGRSEAFGQQPVKGGDVFDVDALGPFVLSVADRGTLASEQWINGRRTFANTRLGTLSFFAAAGRSTSSATAGTGPLVLGFDAGLAADLDREASRFMAANDRLLARMAVVIIDVRTGEIRAISEPARVSNDEPLLSFDPVLVGSAVKPIMAAAILSQHPALADLRLPYAGDSVATVGGVRLAKPFENEANGCSGEIAFNDYLRCSSNQYAAELMVRSLEQDGFTSRADAAVVPRAVLEKSAIATGLAEVFDVDASAARTSGRLALYWNPDSATTPGVAAATTDRSLIPYESRPWIVFPDSAGTRIDLIARYAFGGWENRWTLLGLAQAYARIATDHNVQATFLHRASPSDTTSPFAAASPRAAAAFARVRAALRQVGVNGTAAGLAEHLRDSIKHPVVVLAKTGTLNERGAGGRIKSLAIVVGRAAGTADSAALVCGFVAVSYFEFADPQHQGSQRAALPRIHRDFAEGPLAGVLSRNWNRVSGCPDAPSPRGTK